LIRLVFVLCVPVFVVVTAERKVEARPLGLAAGRDAGG
jgi:hypothetical protein